jgi:putative lipoprotein
LKFYLTSFIKGKTMKILNLALVAACSALLLGCAATKNEAPKPQSTVSQKSYLVSNLPQNIEYDGQIYHQKYQNEFTVEYYLEDEGGYGWSKLISVTYVPSIKNIDDFITAIKKTTDPKKGKFKIEKISSDSSYREEIYYPEPNNPKFNNYEITLDVTKTSECGLVGVSFARNFKTLDELEKTLKAEKFNEKFLANRPVIECK